MRQLLRPLNLEKSDANERRPKYQLVCDHLHSEFSAGRLMPGQALPPEAKLSEILGVSRNTLRQALGKLEDEGMIERVQGRGTFLTSEEQRVSRKRRSAFALLAPEIREGVYPSLIHGFEQSCAGFQHQMVVCNTANEIGKQADLLMQLLDQEIGGVAVVPSTVPTPAYQLTLLQKNYIPVVCCHRTVEGVVAPSVVFSGFENGFKTAEALLERGHRHIAFVFQRRYSMVNEREAGLRAAIDAHPHGKQCELDLYEYGRANIPHGRERCRLLGEVIEQLLTKPKLPTTIFCSDLNEAEQVYLHVVENGLEIPRDISLICFGSSFREGALAQRIASVCIDELELGACAANLLHQIRMGKRAIDNDEQIVFPMSLYEGETLGHM